MGPTPVFEAKKGPRALPTFGAQCVGSWSPLSQASPAPSQPHAVVKHHTMLLFGHGSVGSELLWGADTPAVDTL